MRLLLIAVSFLFILSGCLDTSETELPKRVALYYEIPDIGNEITGSNDDILIVEEYKFIVSGFQLIAEDSVIVQTGDNLSSLVFAYNTEISGERLVLSVPLGFENIDIFKGYKMTVDRARTADNILDNDFYDSPVNYSIVAKGTFNDIEFLYQSSNSFERGFDLGRVELSSNSPSLIISKSIEMRQVFLDSASGEVLNPNQSANKSTLDSNFKNNLILEARAGDI